MPSARRTPAARGRGRPGAAGRGAGARRGRAAPDGATPAPISLRLAVKNFGPVERCDLEIRPLTILMGPNGSGKSYVALLLRSILEAQGRAAGAGFGAAAEACLASLRKKRGRGRGGMAVARPESKKILGVVVDKGLAPALRRQIEADFGSDVRDLVRAGKGAATAEVSEIDPDSGETRRLAIRMGAGLSARMAARPGAYAVEAVPGTGRYRVQADGPGRPATGTRRTRPGGLGRAEAEDPSELLAPCAAEMAEMISSHARFRSAPRGAHYIPAARAGMLLGRGALQGGSDAGGMPVVAGIAGDFASRISPPARASGPFAPLADEMEREMFGGTVEAGAPAGGGRLELALRAGRGGVPLHRGSSMVSEMAPLSMYMRHVVDRGSLVVVEEPEEHLHPANQVVLAKYLVRLVRGGAGIVATTHSTFLLEKLGKYMMAGRLSPGQRAADLGYGRGDFLEDGEVSAYAFERRRGGGHVARPVERDGEYGLSLGEFDGVIDSLNRDSTAINALLRGRGGS